MKLKNITKWLVISALLGLVLAVSAFEQASVKIDGETLSIQELFSRDCEIDW